MLNVWKVKKLRCYADKPFVKLIYRKNAHLSNECPFYVFKFHPL